MRYPWIDEFLLAKRGVTKDLQPDWNWIRYHVGGKMFAAVLLDQNDQPYYINLKLEPDRGEFYRRQYADIIPGYYSNKQCWNSIRPDGQVPDAVLRALLDRSYALVLAGFSKKKQREIAGLSCCGADCAACPLHGSICAGCNAACGRVFHAPEGKACPLYACAVQKHRFTSCASCDRLPCALWRSTRDPALSDEAFERSIVRRVQALKEAFL
ncbi:MAG: MmcQ/YjbR family DNA-binding protein [Clostridia bacterium]|nr:MmcQ/YjbR family DNA-binding protein [Clostridia bacterium]